MMRLKRNILLLLALLVLAGCGGEDVVITEVQVLHAVPDASVSSFTLNTAVRLGNFDYTQASQLFRIHARTYHLEVTTASVFGTTVLIDEPNLQLNTDEKNSLILIGQVSDDTVDYVLIPAATGAVGADNTRMQFIHAAPGRPKYDVFVTTPGADLTASAPLGTVAFKNALLPEELPAGDYQIRITRKDAPSLVVLDAGVFTFVDGSDFQGIIVENTRGGSGLLSLVLQDAFGSIEVLDTGTQASLRAIHLSPDSPAVDVIFDEDLANPFIPGLTFPNVTPYMGTTPAIYDIKVVDSGTQAFTTSEFLGIGLLAGFEYSLYVIGFVAEQTGALLVDDNRSIAGQARVRMFHGAPTLDFADIYITLPGDDFTQFFPAFAGVPFGTDLGFSTLLPDEYEITITPAGDNTIIQLNELITINDGGVYTYIVRDAVGGGAPLELMELIENPGT